MLEKLIIKKRKEKKLSQTEVANSCGVTLKTIFNLEQDTRSIKFNTILEVCKFLDIKVIFE